MGNNLDDPSLDDVYRVEYGDTPNLDAGGLLRVANPFGIFENKNIANRHKNQWEERLTGCIMNISALAGVPVVGDFAVGGTSGKIGVVTGVAGAVITYNTENNDFTDTETITFSGTGAGATATLTNHNTGADLVFNYDESSVELKVGTLSGQKVIRQTHRPLAYLPGKSQRNQNTYVLAPGKANLKQRSGLFDDLNGLYFELDGTEAFVSRRTSTSGVPVDTIIPQSEWNLDKLDGTGKSKVTVDFTNGQLAIIDFLWQGLGRIRYGLEIDGKIIYCHQVLTANKQSVVFMKTPTLPVRFEIENTGAAGSDSTMKEVCGIVNSEGGYVLPGLEFTATRGKDFVTSSLRVPILAIRLKKEFPVGEVNRRVVKWLNTEISVKTNDANFEVRHVHCPWLILTHGVVAGGPFVVGEIITGGTSGNTATIYQVDTPNSKIAYIELSGTLTPTETITGGASGATAAIDASGAGQGVTSWADIGGGSGVEYSLNMPDLIGNPSHIIEENFIFAGQAGKGGSTVVSSEFISLHSFISQNKESTNSEMFVIFMDPDGSAAGRGHLTFIEFE